LETFLEIKNLVSGYSKLAIVQGVSFRVSEGDKLAIIGPNGSGKSTLVRTIFGLTSIFEGTISFRGSEITRLKTEQLIKLGLCLVPQINNVFPDLTVIENLELGFLGNRSGTGRNSVLRNVLETFPILKQKQSQLAGTLSGGERQMLALGRALMSQPELLVLDEPTAALAPMVADQLFRKLEEIHSSGVSLMIVEQNAKRVLKFATRGLVLVQGRIAFEGKPDEISSDSEIVKLFLGKSTNRSQEY
jgi:ABC-type branched-subunit amino acid transport system ATPase component